MDRWEFYERAVQSPRDSLAMLIDAHGGDPRVLAEDFAGSAALSRAWAASAPERRSIAVDLDAQALTRASGVQRVETLVADVRDARSVARARGDVVHAGNFSLGYLHSRLELVAYLRAVRGRLSDRGLFACDTYGGPSAFQLGAWTRSIALPDGARLTSVWERREADAMTSRVVNVLGYRVERDGEIVERELEAFVYDWRLWSVPELADALEEAGFERSRVHATTAPGDGAPARGGDYAVMLTARARRA